MPIESPSKERNGPMEALIFLPSGLGSPWCSPERLGLFFEKLTSDLNYSLIKPSFQLRIVVRREE